MAAEEQKKDTSSATAEFSNINLSLKQDNDTDDIFEEDSAKRELKSPQTAKKRPKKYRGKAKAMRAQLVIQKATEIREEHATELHAQKIIGTDHIIQKPAQASRLTNNESNPSVVTQHQSGELKDSNVTVDVSGESIEAPGPNVQSTTPTPQQLHDSVEDEIIGTLLQILWRSNQNKFGTHPAVTGHAMAQLRELHGTLREGDFTRRAFPTRGEALRAARSRHEVSLRGVLAEENADAEMQIEEAERNYQNNVNENDEELSCHDDDDNEHADY